MHEGEDISMSLDVASNKLNPLGHSSSLDALSRIKTNQSKFKIIKVKKGEGKRVKMTTLFK